MITKRRKLDEFYRELDAKENLSYKEAVRICEALHREAVALGAISSENIWDGFEVDLRIARRLLRTRRKSCPWKIPNQKCVDLIFSPTPYETQAIKRSKRVKISNYSVRFASCEDVIIHKMVSGRAIDEEDIKSILTKNKVSLDHKYIRRWLWQFSKVSENSGIVRSFNDLLKKV